MKTYPIDLAVVFATLMACFCAPPNASKTVSNTAIGVSLRTVAAGAIALFSARCSILGEINDVQHQGWCKTIEVLEEDQRQAHQVALFSEARPAPTLDPATVQVKLRELQLHRPRQWGGVGWPVSSGINWH